MKKKSPPEWALARVCCVALWLGSALVVQAHPEIELQINDLTERIAASPQDSELYLRRGELHRLHRTFDLASRDFRKARKVAPNSIDVDLFEARLELDKNRPKAARKLLNRYVGHRPDSPVGWVTRARARVQLGDPLGAAADFSQAITASSQGNPGPELFLERARALRTAGADHIDDAIAGLEAGLARLGHPVTLELLALELETEAGRFDAAIRRVDRLASQSRRPETWWVRKGEIYQAAAQPDQAIFSFNEALAAIARLSPSRRSSRAVQKLEQSARDALALLQDR